MKNILKTTLLAASIAAAATTSARAFTYNGDLLVGFTSQSGNDFIYDLGQASGLSDGMQWDLSSQLSGFNLSTMYWGVIGDKNVAGTRTAWNTAVGGSVPSTAAWGKMDTATKSIFQNFSVSGTAGDSFSIGSSDDNSWNEQTILGSLTTAYHNVYGNPNFQGTGSVGLFSEIADGSDPHQLGSFNLNNSGVLSFAAVPEPSSMSLITVLGILVIALRRRFSAQA